MFHCSTWAWLSWRTWSQVSCSSSEKYKAALCFHLSNTSWVVLYLSHGVTLDLSLGSFFSTKHFNYIAEIYSGCHHLHAVKIGLTQQRSQKKKVLLLDGSCGSENSLTCLYPQMKLALCICAFMKSAEWTCLSSKCRSSALNWINFMERWFDSHVRSLLSGPKAIIDIILPLPQCPAAAHKMELTSESKSLGLPPGGRLQQLS